MSGSATTLFTPEGIRDGEPASLEGLCRRRAGSVLDYGLAVTTPDRAMEATAEAFARFRGAVIAADDPRALNPETLLLGCTRHATGALVPPAGDQEGCPEIPMLIVDRLDGVISPHDVPRLGSHLLHCPACRRLDAAFHEAERVYRAPHRPELPREVEERVLAALRSAAPITWRGEEDAAPAAPGPVAAPEPVVELPPVEVEPEALPEPEPELAPEPVPDLDLDPEPEVLRGPEPLPVPEPEPEPEVLRGPEPLPFIEPVPEPAAEPGRPDAPDAPPVPVAHDDGDEEDDWPAAVPVADDPAAVTAPPAADDEQVTAVIPAVRRGSGTLVPRILVPTAIVALGATAAMAYAGVFGGRDAAPARGTTGIPAPEPPAMPVPANELEQRRAAEAARAALESTRERERRLAAGPQEAEEEPEPMVDGTSDDPAASSGASVPTPTAATPDAGLGE